MSFEGFSTHDLKDWVQYYLSEIEEMKREIREREKSPPLATNRQ